MIVIPSISWCIQVIIILKYSVSWCPSTFSLSTVLSVFHQSGTMKWPRFHRFTSLICNLKHTAVQIWSFNIMPQKCPFCCHETFKDLLGLVFWYCSFIPYSLGTWLTSCLLVLLFTVCSDSFSDTPLLCFNSTEFIVECSCLWG